VKIFLLTHQREINKTTNTGSLTANVLAEKTEVIVWQRTVPDPGLLETIKSGSIALLYPCDDSQLLSGACDYKNFIVIDGTWQEARKIYNKSPYLQALPSVKITPATPSKFNLRRNQKPGGLCTAECVIEIMRTVGYSELAAELQSSFDAFLVDPSRSLDEH